MREIKEQNPWGDIPCACLGMLNIVKISVLTNLIYRFNTILIEIPESNFVDIEKLILMFIWKRTPRYTVFFFSLVLHIYEKERLKTAHSPLFVWLIQQKETLM